MTSPAHVRRPLLAAADQAFVDAVSREFNFPGSSLTADEIAFGRAMVRHLNGRVNWTAEDVLHVAAAPGHERPGEGPSTGWPVSGTGQVLCLALLK